MTTIPDGLPESCFGTLNTTGELILLKRGAVGYFHTAGYVESPKMSFTELADLLNSRMGYTKGQRAAMEHGTMFGFDTPGADPANWAADGKPIRAHVV